MNDLINLSISLNSDTKLNCVTLIDGNMVEIISDEIGSDFENLVENYSYNLRHNTVSFFEKVKALCVKNNTDLKNIKL